MEGERAHQGDTLAHPTGERVWVMVDEPGEAVPLGERSRLFAVAAGDAPVQGGAEHDVLGHRPPRQQQVLLEHVADVAGRAGDFPAVEENTARGRADESRDDVEQRALAAARGADDRDELALVDLERGRGERRSLAEGVPEVLDPELHRATASTSESRSTTVGGRSTEAGTSRPSMPSSKSLAATRPIFLAGCLTDVSAGVTTVASGMSS